VSFSDRFRRPLLGEEGEVDDGDSRVIPLPSTSPALFDDRADEAPIPAPAVTDEAPLDVAGPDEAPAIVFEPEAAPAVVNEAPAVVDEAPGLVAPPAPSGASWRSSRPAPSEVTPSAPESPSWPLEAGTTSEWSLQAVATADTPAGGASAVLESLADALKTTDADHNPLRQAPREAAPAVAALPLAAPAFGRSKAGAVRRDDVAAPKSPASESVAAPAPDPRPVSVFVPPARDDEPPRATAYALGDKSSTDAPVDPLASLKKRVEDALLRRVGAKLAEGELSEAELRTFVERELGMVLAAEQTALSASEREQIVARLTDDLLGHGPLEPFLQDESVTEVMVNGLEPIYVERNGRIVLTETRFVSDAQLRHVIERVVGRIGRRIDESSPMVDARLPDGSRVNAVIPPLAVDGPALTIRKFSKYGFSVADLVEKGTLSQNGADFLSACVRGRLNILVTGGTGSGKTTMLNVLSSFIPADQRIVTIEDAVELRMHQHHVIRLEARPPNIEGRGEVTIRDLVRNSLRMRPDRIVVGEVRSGEALDMLQAMNTGHDGSLSTLHANQPRDALARLETMVLMAGFELPVRAIREQVTSAVDLIVHVSRLRDGTRRVTHIAEVEGMEGDIITLTDLYLFDYAAGVDSEGIFKGSLKATGLRPKFAERLADLGIDVPLPSMGFDAGGAVAIGGGRWGR
jgi:pilus assembly protein CpaF